MNSEDRNYANFIQLRLCYQSKTMTTEEKIKYIRKKIPKLTEFYEDDLRILFDEQLPFIEAVEIETKFGDSNPKYIAITKMPKMTDKEHVDVIKKAIMRIGGCIGGFKVEPWGNGDFKTDAMRRHMKAYMETHGKAKHLQYVPGDMAGYPKVLEVYWNKVAGAANESYKVTEILGLVLS